MSSKKSLIITKYLKLVEDIVVITNKNIFPDFNDVIDIVFYFNYTFMRELDFFKLLMIY